MASPRRFLNRRYKIGPIGLFTILSHFPILFYLTKKKPNKLRVALKQRKILRISQTIAPIDRIIICLISWPFGNSE